MRNDKVFLELLYICIHIITQCVFQDHFPPDKQGNVWKTLREKYGRAFFWSGVIKVFHDLVMFTPPLILSALLVHVSQPNPSKGKLQLLGLKDE